MPATQEKDKTLIDTRKVRNRVTWGEAMYREVELGLSLTTVRSFKVPSPEIRAIMERTVNAYLEGKVESFGGREVGHRCAQRRVHGYSFQEPHPKGGGRLCWRSAEMALTPRYLLSVCYHTRDDECETADWETGQPIKPWVTMSASDGSAVRLHAILEEEAVEEETEDEVEEETEEEVEEDVEEIVEKPKRGRGRK